MTSERWKQIETLFHQALEKPTEQRPAFLVAACGDDSALRVEVETLLKRDDEDDILDEWASVAPGMKLGHYEILSALGRGGMGEVWRAKDTTLGREVAIKTLPEAFARDPEFLARFEREARLLASLNHPNVAVIHGFEQVEQVRFLVLELIEGQTLDEMLQAGPFPIASALKSAVQIAEALEAAHSKGVVHRDLKPGNIKITPEGTVKVLDFGLAKAVSRVEADSSASTSPGSLTQEGTIQGTPAYMSPEQVRGAPVDSQTDIWAFGCVLFEMLTGQGTFQGDTVSDLMAGVLKADPGWTLLPENLHPRIRLLLERCLERNPRDRYHGIADVRVDLQKVLAHPAGVLVEPVLQPAQAAGRSRLLWLAALGVSVAVAAFAAWNLKPPDPQPVVRFGIQLAEGDATVNVGGEMSVLAISRDGTRTAYRLNGQIYVRAFDALEPRLIAGANGWMPVFSPDGETLAYWDDVASVLKIVSLDGNAPITVSEQLNSISDLSWDDDGMLRFVLPSGIFELPAAGGRHERRVPALEDQQLGSPQLLPDRRAILYTVRGDDDWDNQQIMAYSLESEESHPIGPTGRDVRYLPTDHVVYVRADTLLATPFDPGSLKVTGDEVRFEQGLTRAPTGISDTAQYAVSDTGSLIYLLGDTSHYGADSPRRLVWVDREGNEQSVPAEANYYNIARVSPNGTRLALQVGGGTNTIWSADVETGNLSQLTRDGHEFFPLWSADGEFIFFVSNSDGSVYAIPPEGGAGGEPDFLAAATGFLPLLSSVSRDGQGLAVNAYTTSAQGFAVLDLSNLRFTEPLWDGSFSAFSPDGNWITLETQQREILILPYPDLERRQIRGPRGMHAVWSGDGADLFYFADGCIWAVPVTYQPGFSVGTAPDQLFCGDYVYGVGRRDGLGGRGWDYDPMGDRFLMIAVPNEAGTEREHPQIRVVLNWRQELLERVPVD